MSAMKPHRIQLAAILLTISLVTIVQAADPLPSWNDGGAKRAILTFVEQATDSSSPTYVPVEKRIAAIDNDGTLWVEQPMYTQLAFAIDQIKARADEHPEWKSRQPFQAVLEDDLKTLAASGKQGLLELIMATHAGMTTDEFEESVNKWLASAKHPRFRRPYTECVFQPMIELMHHLRENKFKTFIVSGGGVDFMRPWTEKVYGIPPEQVIGSSIRTKLEMRNGKPVLLRLPEIFFIDDHEGKPVGIHQFMGRRPIIAIGNSDGDLQMLQWCAAGKGLRFMMLVHHTDAEREYAYDRASHFGRLDKALDEAERQGWIVVDMKKDWRVIFPFETK